MGEYKHMEIRISTGLGAIIDVEDSDGNLINPHDIHDWIMQVVRVVPNELVCRVIARCPNTYAQFIKEEPRLINGVHPPSW